MAKPLDGGIAKLVWKGVKAAKLYLPAVLTKITAGARDPANVTAGQAQTRTSYQARGIKSAPAQVYVDGTLITRGDCQISLFGASIAGGAVPAPGDEIVITSKAGAETYKIIDEGVRWDAAAAVYRCACRK